MQTVTITKVLNPTTFTAELVAALPALVTTRPDGLKEAHSQMTLTGTTTTLEVPDDVNLTTVQGVVTAHTAATQSTAQQAAAADTASLSDLATTYQNLLDGLVTISNHMDAILAGPAAPTATQTGTALKTLAQDTKSMVAGQTKVLKALKVFAVRDSGT